ncbi:MAG: cell division protein FtsZ, partial [Pseudomonadota bacterium]
DMLFITAGMGGGTGTGASPMVAQVARELGILTVAVVTRPFVFEGKKRVNVAELGIQELGQHVDSLIIIPNEKLLTVLGQETSLLDAFRAANDVLFSAVQGISELITRPGLINVDFADVTTVMAEMGMAMMGTGAASGENRARRAAEDAISSPLLEDTDLSGARGILVNMTAGLDITIGEFNAVGEVIKSFASEDATVVVGSVIDPELNDEVRVTVIATGVNKIARPEETPARQVAQITEAAAQANPAAEPKKTPNIETDYERLDAPTVLRHKRRDVSDRMIPEDKDTNNTDYLDIPAFLRRQAD